MLKGMGELQENVEGNGRVTGRSFREWERHRRMLKGMGEIQENPEGNGRVTGEC